MAIRKWKPLACLLVSLGSVTGCDLPGRPDRADQPVPADQVMEFASLYSQNCAGCHGATGKLGPAPPLNDALFRAIVPEDELKEVITRGRNKTLMPAFAKENGGTLSASQIDVLVKEIKGIPYKIVENRVVAAADGAAPKWGKPAIPPADVPAYHAPSSVGDKKKGEAVFARACADCHGSNGQGSKSAGAINDAVFLGLCSDQVLRRYAITGRPDLGMPSFESRPASWHFVPLTDADLTDLIALLASWRNEK